jgi:hypothetical protein
MEADIWGLCLMLGCRVALVGHVGAVDCACVCDRDDAEMSGTQRWC